jgi:hypothetical protein
MRDAYLKTGVSFLTFNNLNETAFSTVTLIFGAKAKVLRQ